MEARRLDYFKTLLLKQRERILNQGKKDLIHHLTLEPEEMSDENDAAQAANHQHLSLQLHDRDAKALVKIDYALEKVEDQEFGLCEECDSVIEEKRLKARPTASLCISCQEQEERKIKIFTLHQPSPIS